MVNQEVSTHKQRKIFKQNNRRYTDIPIYNWATKKELSALKRDFYIKRAKEKRKKHSHVQEGTTKAA